MTGLATLRTAYRDRLAAARRAAARGKRVIGLVGHCVPVELVWAAGCFAVQLTPSGHGPTPAADGFMEEQLDRDTRSLFDRFLRGEFDFCAGVVIAATSDANRHLFHYVREVARQGVRDTLPPLHAFDMMFGDLPALRHYGLDRMRELARFLRLIGGHDVEPRLDAVVAMAHRRRTALQRLDRLRRARLVSGVDAIHAIGAGSFLEPESCQAELEAALTTFEGAAPLSGARTIIVPAVPLHDDRLHRLVEDAGVVVIAEDDTWGARPAADELAGPPTMDSLFAAYHAAAAAPRAPAAQREAWLRRRLREGGIDLVVVYIPPDDQDFGWSYPALRDLLDGHGLRHIAIRENADDPAAAATIARQLAAKIGMPA